MYDIMIVGAGAAGCMAANQLLERAPNLRFTVVEKTHAPLAKVRASGGGRCNFTHHCDTAATFASHYPRGQKEMLGLLHRFSPTSTCTWFASHGAPSKTESDGRIFPQSDRSNTVVQALLKAISPHLQLGVNVQHLARDGDHFLVTTSHGPMHTRRLLLTTGGNAHCLAQNLGHTIVEPVPALFALETAPSCLHALAGIQVPDATVAIVGTRWKTRGSLLLTHNGLTGPCILQISSLAARWLHANNYTCDLSIQWLTPETVDQHCGRMRTTQGTSTIVSTPTILPKRLWHGLLTEHIGPDLTWAQLNKNTQHSLAEILTRTHAHVVGRALNRDEFVQCGGVPLQEVNLKTMESKICPHLFFAGEILDIDGLTGGFNLQAAWSTGCCAADGMSHA